MDKLKYLQDNLFQGLKNLNTGFDAETICYFSELDFEIVLDRAKNLGIEIMGIEPWLDGEFYDVATIDDAHQPWPQSAFERFRNTGLNLQYAATYNVPQKLLGSNKK